MLRKEYLEFLQDESRDMMELYYEYYKIKGGSLSFAPFVHYFSLWIFERLGVNSVSNLQYFVFQELNKHFFV